MTSALEILGHAERLRASVSQAGDRLSADERRYVDALMDETSAILRTLRARESLAEDSVSSMRTDPSRRISEAEILDAVRRLADRFTRATFSELMGEINAQGDRWPIILSKPVSAMVRDLVAVGRLTLVDPGPSGEPFVEIPAHSPSVDDATVTMARVTA